MGSALSDNKTPMLGSHDPADGEHRVGDEIAGRYRLDEHIGEGGMGVIFAAQDLQLDRRVAIKLIRPMSTSENMVERLEREARAAARLGHPNIVPVLEFGFCPQGNPFLVMQLLDGCSLDASIKEGALGIEEAVDVHLQILEGLSVAHNAHVLHRDLKPANIFLTPFGRGRMLVRLLDFGLAYLMEDGAKKLTAKGIAIGTPAYMAPERVLGDPADARCDIYAVGVCLFEALTGERPFQASSGVVLQGQILMIEAPDPRQYRPEIPGSVAAVIARSLAKKPDDRYQSAEDMRDALIEASQNPGKEVYDGPSVELPSKVAHRANTQESQAASHSQEMTKEASWGTPSADSSRRMGALSKGSLDMLAKAMPTSGSTRLPAEPEAQPTPGPDFQSAQQQPAQSQPAQSQPAQSQPAQSQPAQSQPAEAQPPQQQPSQPAPPRPERSPGKQRLGFGGLAAGTSEGAQKDTIRLNDSVPSPQPPSPQPPGHGEAAQKFEPAVEAIPRPSKKSPVLLWALVLTLVLGALTGLIARWVLRSAPVEETSEVSPDGPAIDEPATHELATDDPATAQAEVPEVMPAPAEAAGPPPGLDPPDHLQVEAQPSPATTPPSPRQAGAASGRASRPAARPARAPGRAPATTSGTLTPAVWAQPQSQVLEPTWD